MCTPVRFQVFLLKEKKECVCRLTDCVVVCRARPDGGGVRPLHAHARQMCPRAGQVSFKETIQQDLRGFGNGSVNMSFIVGRYGNRFTQLVSFPESRFSLKETNHTRLEH